MVECLVIYALQGMFLNLFLLQFIMCGKTYKLTLVLIAFLFSQGLLAQVLVTGKVVDQQSGEVVPGVNIAINNANKGTVSDHRGEFSISVQDSAAVLSFSSI